MSPQRPKRMKRPRAYHHGRAQGRVNESKIKRALPAFERAEADMEEITARASEYKREIDDWGSMLAAVSRLGCPVMGALE